jgi:hypothetical protein
MGYYHSITFSTVSKAKRAMKTIQDIDKRAELGDEVAPYEDQDVEQDILFNTKERLTVEQRAAIDNLKPLGVDLDNPDD